MSNPFAQRVGGILSADITVPEHERELRFYSRIHSTGESPLWREDRMNVLLDPNGAAFGIIPVVSAEALPPTEDGASRDSAARVGCISWLDLTVSEASASGGGRWISRNRNPNEITVMIASHSAYNRMSPLPHHERNPSMPRIAVALPVSLVSSLVIVALMHAHPGSASAAQGKTWIEIKGLGGPLCDPELSIRNVGSEASKAVVIYFGERDTALSHPDPAKVECTGLMAPGETWRFTPMMMMSGAKRAVLVSFNAKMLSEVGVDVQSLGFDDVVADLMCETLFFSIVGDRADYDQFAAAYHSGGEFAGVPLARTVGAPITASVDIAGCGPRGLQLSPDLERKVPAESLDAALADPASISGFGQLRDPGKPHGPYNGYRTCLVLQKSSTPWHPLHNSLVLRASCQ
jgi:hypothetical protein